MKQIVPKWTDEELKDIARNARYSSTKKDSKYYRTWSSSVTKDRSVVFAEKPNKKKQKSESLVAWEAANERFLEKFPDKDERERELLRNEAYSRLHPDVFDFTVKRYKRLAAGAVLVAHRSLVRALYCLN